MYGMPLKMSIIMGSAGTTIEWVRYPGCVVLISGIHCIEEEDLTQSLCDFTDVRLRVSLEQGLQGESRK